MINILVLVGKTASGKDTIMKRLLEIGYNSIVSHTTRPMRYGDEDGSTYHFVSKEEFLKLKRKGGFVETTSYDVANGETWFYGLSVKELLNATENSIAILNPEGLRAINEIENFDVISCYVETDEETIKERLKKRGDNPEEAQRRLEADRKDFEGIKSMVDFTIRNDTIEDFENNVNIIYTMYKEKMKSKTDFKKWKPTSKPKLYFDFDGVIVNTIKAITYLYNEDFKYYKNFKPIHWTTIETWEFAELNCASAEYINTYFNQQRFFDKLEFMPWAYESLICLSEHFDITIVSAGYSPNLKAKEEWIKNKLPFCKFIGVDLKEHNDKSHINMSDGIFVDDSANNLKTSNSMLNICFEAIYPWNIDWKGYRVYDWEDLCKLLNEKER